MMLDMKILIAYELITKFKILYKAKWKFTMSPIISQTGKIFFQKLVTIQYCSMPIKVKRTEVRNKGKKKCSI